MKEMNFKEFMKFSVGIESMIDYIKFFFILLIFLGFAEIVLGVHMNSFIYGFGFAIAITIMFRRGYHKSFMKD